MKYGMRTAKRLILSILVFILLTLHWNLNGTPWGKAKCLFECQAYIRDVFPFPVKIQRIVYSLETDDYQALCYPTNAPEATFWIGHLSFSESLENDFHLSKWKLQIEEFYSAAFPSFDISVSVTDASSQVFTYTLFYPTVEEIPDIFDLQDTSFLNLRFSIIINKSFQEVDKDLLDSLYELFFQITQTFPADQIPPERSFTIYWSDHTTYFLNNWKEKTVNKETFLLLLKE